MADNETDSEENEEDIGERNKMEVVSQETTESQEPGARGYQGPRVSQMSAES